MLNKVSNSQVSFDGPIRQANRFSQRLCGSSTIFVPGNNGRMFAVLPVDADIKGPSNTLMPLIGEGKGKLGAAIDLLRQIEKVILLFLKTRLFV